MAFVKMKKLNNRSFTSALDYPAILIKTGRSNSAINSVFVRTIKKRAGDTVGLDIYHDPDTGKFGIQLNDEGDWQKKVSKSSQIQLWLGQFFKNNGVHLKGADDYKTDKNNKTGESAACALEYNKKEDMWIFELPANLYADVDDETSVKKTIVKKKKKHKKVLSK